MIELNFDHVIGFIIAHNKYLNDLSHNLIMDMAKHMDGTGPLLYPIQQQDDEINTRFNRA